MDNHVEMCWINGLLIKTLHRGVSERFSCPDLSTHLQVVFTGYPRKNVIRSFTFDPFLDIVQTTAEFFTTGTVPIILDLLDRV